MKQDFTMHLIAHPATYINGQSVSWYATCCMYAKTPKKPIFLKRLLHANSIIIATKLE